MGGGGVGRCGGWRRWRHVALRPDLHLGPPQGVVAPPQLPDDPAEVIVGRRHRVVLSVQVGLEAAVSMIATRMKMRYLMGNWKSGRDWRVYDGGYEGRWRD